jgi:hypothetical protein
MKTFESRVQVNDESATRTSQTRPPQAISLFGHWRVTNSAGLGSWESELVAPGRLVNTLSTHDVTNLLTDPAGHHARTQLATIDKTTDTPPAEPCK